MTLSFQTFCLENTEIL